MKNGNDGEDFFPRPERPVCGEALLEVSKRCLGSLYSVCMWTEGVVLR